MMIDARKPKPQPLRVLVCGGRHYIDYIRIHKVLSQLPPIATIIHSGALGADALAGRFASRFAIPVEVFKANWAIGRVAGPLRNQAMIDEGKPDLVVAFPGGYGTRDIVRRARDSGIKVMEITD